MKARVLAYLATNDIQGFRAFISNDHVSHTELSEFRFCVGLENQQHIELDFFQYAFLHGSPEFKAALIESNILFNKLSISLEFFLRDNIARKDIDVISQALFIAYSEYVALDNLIKNILDSFFKEDDLSTGSAKLANLVRWITLDDNSEIFIKDFNDSLQLYMEDNAINRGPLNAQMVENFFSIAGDIIDKDRFIEYYVPNSAVFEMFRRNVWELLDDSKRRFRVERFLRNFTIEEICISYYAEFAIKHDDLLKKFKDEMSKELFYLLIEDLDELILTRKAKNNLNGILKLIFPSCEEANEAISKISLICGKSFISFYNPEIFELIISWLDSVDHSQLLSGRFTSFLESRYPVVLFEDTENYAPKESNPKKRKREEGEVLDFETSLLPLPKRSKTQFKVKSRLEILQEYLKYFQTEKSFQNSAKINLKELSRNNIKELKLEIMQYICMSKAIAVETDPRKFFSCLKLDENLSMIFTKILESDLIMYHFSNAEIKDYILSYKKLKEARAEFEGFTNENDVKTGNTGYVFAGTSFTFDGIATSFVIHSFLNITTKIMYQTHLTKLETLPHMVLTMQDWMMYNETISFTSSIGEGESVEMSFLALNKPEFIREKIFKVKRPDQTQDTFKIKRDQELFYGREIQLGLALSTIRLLSKFGQSFIENLATNLSLTNLSNFIGMYMPLELKIPNAVPVAICNVRERIGTSWSELAVTPYNR